MIRPHQGEKKKSTSSRVNDHCKRMWGLNCTRLSPEAFPPVTPHTHISSFLYLWTVPSLECVSLLPGESLPVPCKGSPWWLGSARPRALKAKTMSELSSCVDFCYNVHDKCLPDEGTDRTFCQADVHYLHERFLWLDNIYSPLTLTAINVAK